MSGSLAIGGIDRNDHLNINSGSVLRVEGNLTVYGDLNLNSNSTIEFIGNNSSIHVYGEVRKNKNSNVIGNYTDTSDKL